MATPLESHGRSLIHQTNRPGFLRLALYLLLPVWHAAVPAQECFEEGLPHDGELEGWHADLALLDDTHAFYRLNGRLSVVAFPEDGEPGVVAALDQHLSSWWFRYQPEGARLLLLTSGTQEAHVYTLADPSSPVLLQQQPLDVQQPGWWLLDAETAGSHLVLLTSDYAWPQAHYALEVHSIAETGELTFQGSQPLEGDDRPDRLHAFGERMLLESVHMENLTHLRIKVLDFSASPLPDHGPVNDLGHVFFRGAADSLVYCQPRTNDQLHLLPVYRANPEGVLDLQTTWDARDPVDMVLPAGNRALVRVLNSEAGKPGNHSEAERPTRLQVLDMEDPAAPQILNTVSADELESSILYPRAFSGNRLALRSGEERITLLSLGHEGQVLRLQHFGFPESYQHMQVLDGSLLLSGSLGMIRLEHTADGQAPVLLAETECPGRIRRMSADGHLIVYEPQSDEPAGLQVLDCGSHTDMVPVAGIPVYNNYSLRAIQVDEERLFVLNNRRRLFAYDLGVPWNPQPRGSYELEYNRHERILAYGNHLLLVWDEGVDILDLDGPGEDALIGGRPLVPGSDEFLIHENMLLVAGNWGIRIYSLDYLPFPAHLGQLDIELRGPRLFSDERGVVLSSGYRGIGHLNLEDPSDPRIDCWSDSVSTSSGRDLVALGETVYVLDGGLRSYRYTAQTALDREPLPPTFALGAPAPNPFNPSTRVTFQLAQAGPVRLEVYNLLGARVASLVDEALPAGEHALRFDAGKLASGVYFLQLRQNGEVETRKLLLLR